MTHYPDQRRFEGVTNWLLASALSVGVVSLLLLVASFALFPGISSRAYLWALAALTLVAGFMGRNAYPFRDTGWRKLAAASVVSCGFAGSLITAILIFPGLNLESRGYADRAQRRASDARESADQLAFYQARRICFDAVSARTMNSTGADRESGLNSVARYRDGTNRRVISVTGQTSLMSYGGKTALNAFACEVEGAEAVKIAVVPEADRHPGEVLVPQPVKRLPSYGSARDGAGG
jgi:hypothetical protein